MHHAGALLEIVFLIELSDHILEVPLEACALLGGAQGAFGNSGFRFALTHILRIQHRQPRHGVIPLALEKLLAEGGRPVLTPCFVTVQGELPERLAHRNSKMFAQGINDLLKVEAGGARAHLVHLQGMDIFGHRMGRRAGRGVAKAIDDPIASGSVPSQPPLLVHLLAQVKDRLGIDGVGFRHGQHGDVPVEIELGLGLREHSGKKGRALHLRGGEGHPLHGKLRDDPRAAGRRIAHAVVHADFQPEPLRFARGKLHHLPPFRAAVGDVREGQVERRCIVGHDRRGEVENRRAANARGLHRLQILGDPLLADIRAHPVPPDIGADCVGRVLEILLQGTGV